MFTDEKRASDFSWSMSFLVTYSLAFCLFVSSFHEVYFMIYFLTMEKQIGNLQCETGRVLEASAILLCRMCSFFLSCIASDHTWGTWNPRWWNGMPCRWAWPPRWSYLHPLGHVWYLTRGLGLPIDLGRVRKFSQLASIPLWELEM